MAVIRLAVEPDGRVAECRLLVDRVKSLAGKNASIPAALADLKARASDLRFPPAAAASIVTIPVGYGPRPEHA
jgi:hypothetical protein